MSTTFGNFTEVDDKHEYLAIGFSPSTLPIQRRWRNNGLSADFLADYWGTFFPAADRITVLKHANMKNSIAYIANELLENTMKFHYKASQDPISIRLSLFPEGMRCYVTNSIDPDCVGQFQEYIRKLLTDDLEILYMNQLEKNAHDQDGTISRLGLLTMLYDYHVKLAWRFFVAQDSSQVPTVTTMAELEF